MKVKKIEREGKIEAIGRDPEHPGLIIIEIPLNDEPDRDWINCFEHPSKWTPSVHMPRVSVKTILWRSPEDSIEKDIHWVFDYMEQANVCYERVMKKREEEQKRIKERERLEAEKLRTITEQLKDL